MKRNSLLWFGLVWLLLLFFACTKTPAPVPASTTNTTSNVKVKLRVWYSNPDSIQYSVGLPCYSPGYTKADSIEFTCAMQKQNVSRTIFLQQTSTALLTQDSFLVSVYDNGTLIKQASGKKLLTTNFIY